MRRYRISVLYAVSIIGFAVYVAGLWSYWTYGFSQYIWLYWLLGCVLLLAAASGWGFANKYKSRGILHENNVIKANVSRSVLWRDICTLLLLAIVFVPMYTFRVHDFPRQMNTDEISIMATAKTLATQPNVDIFAPSYYSDLPGFIFWLFGELGMLLGGVTLENMRLLHALSGVCIILSAYILFRLLQLPRYAALAGAAVLALNHSLFFISRMAMRDNTALLFGLAAFILLLYGWQRKSYGWTLLGGSLSGLTFYTYYPSRITIVVWLVFVVAAVVAKLVPWRQAVGLGSVAVFGTALIVAPLVIATGKHTPVDPYANQQYLWLDAAREQERLSRGKTTQTDAVKENIAFGLTTFNRTNVDRAGIYTHFGYGFVDTFTGILLWIGITSVIVFSVMRRKLSEPDIFVLIGFLVIWLSLAFLLTKAPNYTRLLMILPFVAYLAVRPLSLLDVIEKIRKSRLLRWLPIGSAIVVVFAVGGANGRIAHHFYELGKVNGDSVGDTLRLQERHAGQPVLWTFVPGNTTNYYYWGDEAGWRFWLHFGKTEKQDVAVVHSRVLSGNPAINPGPGRKGYLLTTGETWQSIESTFRAERRVQSVEWLDPAGNRVAVSYQ